MCITFDSNVWRQTFEVLDDMTGMGIIYKYITYLSSTHSSDVFQVVKKKEKRAGMNNVNAEHCVTAPSVVTQVLETFRNFEIEKEKMLFSYHFVFLSV